MKLKQLMLILGATTLLVACSRDIKTQEYYFENLDEAKKTSQFCDKKQREGEKLIADEYQDCKNAALALAESERILIDNGH